MLTLASCMSMRCFGFFDFKSACVTSEPSSLSPGWRRWSAPTAPCPQTAARPLEACKSRLVISNIFIYFFYLFIPRCGRIPFSATALFHLTRLHAFFFSLCKFMQTSLMCSNLESSEKCCWCLLLFDSSLNLKNKKKTCSVLLLLAAPSSSQRNNEAASALLERDQEKSVKEEM